MFNEPHRNAKDIALLRPPVRQQPHSGDAHRVAVNRGFVIIMGRWDIVYIYYDLKVVRKYIKKGKKKVITIIPISIAWWDRAFRIHDWKWNKKMESYTKNKCWYCWWWLLVCMARLLPSTFLLDINYIRPENKMIVFSTVRETHINKSFLHGSIVFGWSREIHGTATDIKMSVINKSSSLI